MKLWQDGKGWKNEQHWHVLTTKMMMMMMMMMDDDDGR